MTDGGKQYAAFIEAELKAENERRASLNSRAATALTASAGLVTVVLAVLTVVGNRPGDHLALTGWAKDWLVVALVSLLCSGFFAVSAGAPWLFKAAKPKTLFYFLDNSWGDEEVRARKRTTYCNAMVVKAQRRGNIIKGYCLLGSTICQGFAVMALAFCTIVVV
jgi:hypothetical protein